MEHRDISFQVIIHNKSLTPQLKKSLFISTQ